MLLWNCQKNPPNPLPELFKGWKGLFFRVCANKRNPTALDGFPLYWTEKPKLVKPKSLDELSSSDRRVCETLVGLKIVFNTLKLITCEFNARTLSSYFGRETSPFLCPPYPCLLIVLSMTHACDA